MLNFPKCGTTTADYNLRTILQVHSFHQRPNNLVPLTYKRVLRTINLITDHSSHNRRPLYHAMLTFYFFICGSKIIWVCSRFLLGTNYYSIGLMAPKKSQVQGEVQIN